MSSPVQEEEEEEEEEILYAKHLECLDHLRGFLLCYHHAVFSCD